MAARERLVTLGRRRGQRLTDELGDAVRELRIGLGLSRAALADALGISPSKLQRWESGQPPHPDLVDVAVLMRVLGHDFVAKWYPAGPALRDAAHAALVAAFAALIPADLPCAFESPIPAPGDLRAWDVRIRLDHVDAGVIVETRLRNWQALLRREQQKARDSGVQRLLLVLLDSHANRGAVRAAGSSLREAFPLDGRAILPALRSGRDPGANGLLFLRPASARQPPPTGGIGQDSGLRPAFVEESPADG